MKLQNLTLNDSTVTAVYAVDKDHNEFDGTQIMELEDVENVTLKELKAEVGEAIKEVMDVINFRVNNTRRVYSSPSDHEPVAYDVDFSTPQPRSGNSLSGRVRLTREEYEAAGSDQDKLKAKISELVTETGE